MGPPWGIDPTMSHGPLVGTRNSSMGPPWGIDPTTSYGALAGTRNSSMGPPWRIDPKTSYGALAGMRNSSMGPPWRINPKTSYGALAGTGNSPVGSADDVTSIVAILDVVADNAWFLCVAVLLRDVSTQSAELTERVVSLCTSVKSFGMVAIFFIFVWNSMIKL